MTGPENYQRAEKLAAQALGQEPALAAVNIALAQVHAVLALAAATALRATDGSLPYTDFKAWYEIAHVPLEEAVTP